MVGQGAAAAQQVIYGLRSPHCRGLTTAAADCFCDARDAGAGTDGAQAAIARRGAERGIGAAVIITLGLEPGLDRQAHDHF